MSEILYRLDNFEGPLDLLLHLISKNKLDLKEIKIAEICNQYVQYVEQMRELNLDIAGDFLEMASRLLYLKSKVLLPKAQSEEEDEDVLDLVRMLEEYQKVKEAALELKTGYELYSKSLVKEPEEMNLPVKYEISEEPRKLILAYQRLLERAPKGNLARFDSFQGIVGREIYPVGEKIKEILDGMKHKTKIIFQSLFKNVENRSEIVAVFLAVLELLKSNRVKAEDSSGDVVLIQKDSRSE